jgi:nicotinate-nucleotide adenylyltransferase
MIRGLLGGSFDPVHNGHVAMVAHVLARGLVDHVVVVPARLSPHKDATSAPPADRVAMAALAFAGRAQVTVDPRETRRGGPSYTVDTLRALVAEHPGDDWRLIIGADNLADLPRWRASDTLLTLAEVLVLQRGGAAPEVPRGCDAARFRFVADFDEPVSSTDIRAMLARGRLPVADLPAGVAAHIRQHGLYGFPRS